MKYKMHVYSYWNLTNIFFCRIPDHPTKHQPDPKIWYQANAWTECPITSAQLHILIIRLDVQILPDNGFLAGYLADLHDPQIMFMLDSYAFYFFLREGNVTPQTRVVF